MKIIISGSLEQIQHTQFPINLLTFTCLNLGHEYELPSCIPFSRAWLKYQLVDIIGQYWHIIDILVSAYMLSVMHKYEVSLFVRSLGLFIIITFAVKFNVLVHCCHVRH